MVQEYAYVAAKCIVKSARAFPIQVPVYEKDGCAMVVVVVVVVKERLGPGPRMSSLVPEDRTGRYETIVERRRGEKR